MKLVTLDGGLNTNTNNWSAGLLFGDIVVNLEAAFADDIDIVYLLSSLTENNELGIAIKAAYGNEFSNIDKSSIYPLDKVKLLAALPLPNSLRDFYAFEEHVKNARRRRGLEMIPEWYEIPVFYFSNHNAIYSPYDKIPFPKHTQALDFELEVAAIIGKSGENIAVEEAESYIAGYTIMNDWSARDIQRKEMAVGLGPAKGKDFATSLGPWIVTPDELEDRRSGKGYDLQMVARRNGVEISRGNWNTIYWSFAEMIARASEDCVLFPGDVIGSGTVGTGCILELGPENVGGWLQPGDVIELEIERLGVLRNTIGEPSKSKM
jgi:2-keto-4-pentenoate hydratase/2-oxohepta-3-ene-1,7-dioic acid hydratase in catechol pathway